jgi:hypothetical protein
MFSGTAQISHQVFFLFSSFEWLETAGKLRKPWDYLSELRSSV